MRRVGLGKRVSMCLKLILSLESFKNRTAITLYDLVLIQAPFTIEGAEEGRRELRAFYFTVFIAYMPGAGALVHVQF